MATRIVQQTLEFRVPPTRVYRALTRAEELTRWWADLARIEPRKGGQYRFAWNEGYVHEGAVLDAAAPRRLVLDWPQDGRTTRLAFSLRKLRSGTALRLRQSGVEWDPANPGVFEGVSLGWMYYLTNLRTYLETGRDLRRPADRYW